MIHEVIVQQFVELGLGSLFESSQQAFDEFLA
jgi:hypothetical protein